MVIINAESDPHFGPNLSKISPAGSPVQNPKLAIEMSNSTTMNKEKTIQIIDVNCKEGFLRPSGFYRLTKISKTNLGHYSFNSAF